MDMGLEFKVAGGKVATQSPVRAETLVTSEGGPLRAVHLLRHKWPGGLVN